MDTYEVKAKIVDDALIRTLTEKSNAIIEELEIIKVNCVSDFIAEFIDRIPIDDLVHILTNMDVEHKRNVMELTDRLKKLDNEILEKSQKFDLLFNALTISSTMPETILAGKKKAIDKCILDKSSEFSTELVRVRQRGMRIIALM